MNFLRLEKFLNMMRQEIYMAHHGRRSTLAEGTDVIMDVTVPVP